MPSRRSSPPPSPSDGGIEHVFASPQAEERQEQLADEFDHDLRAMGERFTKRRRSRTLDATDIDDAFAWLTRPGRKAAARNAIASIVTFAAAGLMAYGINRLSALTADVGGWFVVTVSVLFGLFAEVFRRWEYD